MSLPTNNPAERAGSASKQILKTVYSVLILAVAAGAAYGLTFLKQDPPNKPPEQLVLQVRVEKVRPFQGSLDLDVSGTVVPHREVHLATEVGGTIAEKSPLCVAGKLVHKDDLLVQIDRKNFELALQTAVSEVSQAEIMIRETDEEISGLLDSVRLAKEQVKILDEEYQRNIRLGTVVSRSELDQSRRSLLDAETQLSNRENSLAMTRARTERMSAGLELAKRKFERAELDLERTAIRAPFDGVVVEDRVEQDDFVQPGTVLVVLEDTSRVEIMANLTETDMNWIRKNAPREMAGETSDETGLQKVYRLPQLPVVIRDARNPNVEWIGRLDRFDGIGRDELTKATPVKIVVENPVLETPRGLAVLVRGMFVQCHLKIVRGSDLDDDPLLAFPAIAVKPGGFVWVVDGESRLSRRMVDVITISSEKIAGNGAATESTQRLAVVRTKDGGLVPGNQIVVSPMSHPTEGAVVRLENSAIASNSVASEGEIGTEENAAKLSPEKQPSGSNGSATPVANDGIGVNKS